MTAMHDSDCTPAATQSGMPQHEEHHTPCPVCRSPITRPVIQLSQIPIHCNLLWPSRTEAIAAPKGDMHLAFCAHCGHFFNAVFDPARMDYDQTYENSLHFSPRFQQYIESLAADLIERHDLHHKRVIEIGCGQGDFLRLLCEQGQNRGMGFDPAYVPDPHARQSDEHVHIVQDFYSEQYAHEAADLICCRHTLEHIHAPIPFMQAVRRSIDTRSDIVVFFEVPNALFTVRDLGIWDLIYEHCAYFTEYSLARLFLEQGFAVHDVRETYGGQFLCIEATPHAATSDGLAPAVPADVLDQVDSFTAKYHAKVSTMGGQLGNMAHSGQKVVAWGSGSKGVTFLNVFKTQDQIPYIVDLNPRKQGMFVAGTGQRIVGPEFLKMYQPDVVIVMNAIYADEIRTMLQDLRLEPEILLA